MDFSRCQPPCSRLIANEDQNGKCVRCVGLAHAQDAVFGISNCKYSKNLTLKTLHARLAVFDRESAVLPRHAAPEASFLREAAVWRLEAELDAMESEQFSLSLPPSPGITAQILQSRFLSVVLHPAQRHRTPVPSGWRIFYIPRPPTLRTSGPHHSMFSRLAARRCGLLWPILRSSKF